MGFSVSTEAAKWYQKELDLNPGDYVRFYIKLYGGIPTVHPSFYLGVSKGKEGEVDIRDIANRIIFYFNKRDSWFLEEYDLSLGVENNVVSFHFREI
ncbi:hypothetical protein [Aquibacillus kalidii]|uniref:hypothetical protein n=1 Tax=Aquibacillus kalidii TaxID=2762597 RepID=UPI001647C0FD|nr:hypothetical protein [Aquibacillus kalidii]